MSVCARCSAQHGKLVRAEPHPRLRNESTRIAGDSETYAYVCKDCTTKWLRVIPKPDVTRETWRSVSHLPEPV